MTNMRSDPEGRETMSAFSELRSSRASTADRVVLE
jgi:hypothetical protein